MNMNNEIHMQQDIAFSSLFIVRGTDSNNKEMVPSKAIRLFARLNGYKKQMRTGWGIRQDRKPQLHCYGPKLSSVVEFMKSKHCYSGTIDGETIIMSYYNNSEDRQIKRQNITKQYKLFGDKHKTKMNQYLRDIAYGLGYDPNNGSANVHIAQYGNDKESLPSNSDDIDQIKTWVRNHLKKSENENKKMKKKMKKNKKEMNRMKEELEQITERLNNHESRLDEHTEQIETVKINQRMYQINRSLRYNSTLQIYEFK